MVGYYLGGSRGIPDGATVFFGESAPSWWGWALWFSSSLLLSMPFVLLWTGTGRRRQSLFLLAVLLATVPPLGFIGWCSPLAVAGVVFPGTGWLGLGLTLALIWLLAGRNGYRKPVIGALVVTAGICNIAFQPADKPLNWAGQDTSFPGLSSAGRNFASQRLAAMQRVEWVKAFVQTVPRNSVRVLPETVLGTFDGIADFALQEAVAALQSKNSRVLVGAELPLPNGEYKNAVLVLGAKDGESPAAIQGIPVPVAMWKPWASNGAVANPFGRDSQITVKGVRVSALVCYEQVLAYAFLWQMVQRPQVVVPVSNVWWARHSSVPQVQGQMVETFSRLFGIPAVSAVNS